MRTTHKAVGLLQWLRSSQKQLSSQYGTESEAVTASSAHSTVHRRASAVASAVAHFGWRAYAALSSRVGQELSSLSFSQE